MSGLSDKIAKKHVLVIGNGAAGSQITAQLAKCGKYKVTVVTPFNYMEVSLNMTTTVAAGSEAHDKCIFPLLQEKSVEYIVDSCASLLNGSAVLLSGRVVTFDACVVATGQRIPLFYPAIEESTIMARKEAIEKVHSKLVESHNILISGAGPVGSELAGDIKLRHKSKTITLVCPQEHVLSMMTQPLPLLATEHLREIGVDVISNDRVVSHEDGEVLLASGRRIACDLYIPAFATGGNSSFLPAGSVDERGYILVEDTFEVRGFSNVFALGDCSNYDRVKTFPRIDDQLPTVLHNVKAVLRGSTDLWHHVRGRTLGGQLNGPLLVAFGHGLSEGWGVGPDFGGVLGFLVWLSPLFGWPLGSPVGHFSSWVKSVFNNSIIPRLGHGIKRYP